MDRRPSTEGRCVMVQLLSLESFEDCPKSNKPPSADYETGYEEGFAAATAISSANTKALEQTLVQAIVDIDFSFAEARAELLGALSPLLTKVVNRLLPEITAASFGPVIVETLLSAAAADTDKSAQVHVHPSQHESIKKLMAAEKQNVVVIEDPNLTEHSAWIGLAQDETFLDADSLLAEIRAALNAVSLSENRVQKHG